MKLFKIEINCLTSYVIANDQDDALDYYAIDSGYKSYDHLMQEHPLDENDHVVITSSGVFFCDKRRIKTIVHPLSDKLEIPEFITLCMDDDGDMYEVTWQFESAKSSDQSIDSFKWDCPEYIVSVIPKGDS